MSKLIKWTIFEVTSENPLSGIKFHGRMRKLGISLDVNLLLENDQGNDTCVRFAIPDDEINQESMASIYALIKKISSDAQILFKQDGVVNPVLSKLCINDESRYEL